MKFFWNNTSGLNADIERHRAEEKELLVKIADLEQKQDPMSIAALRVYRRFLAQLQQSKADVVNKLGRKK
jgi:phytoene/squalene synthetase